MSSLPKHTVRESQRAKYVNLKISVEHGLEVIIPKGFDRGMIPEILEQKRSWIERTQQRLDERRDFLAAQPSLPDKIELQAIDEVWTVEYLPAAGDAIRFSEWPKHRLVLRGNIQDVELCRLALRKWLAQKAEKHLVPQLRQISRTEKLSFKRAIVRGQKTRWGSCSTTGTVSLNFKLLFLPAHLVRYVLIHELCHTKQMNHSKKFWALVGKKEPQYKKARVELRKAWRHVPGWLQK